MSENLVVIPTYNEAENITAILERVLHLPVLFDVLIVDDGSPDGTAQLVKELQQAYPGRILLSERSGKLGLGTAYLHGFQIALEKEYQFVCEMDADFSHNPADLVNLWKACAQEGADVAVGSRYVRGVNGVNWPMSRVLLSWGASKYVRFITGMPVADPTAGFICYRRAVLQTLPLQQIRFVGYAFQIEMKFLAWKYGFQLSEVPIIFTDRTRGESKMSKGIISEAFWGVIQLKLESLFRRYLRG